MAIAGTTHDIVLNGVGYMLAGGKDSYVCSGTNGPFAPGFNTTSNVQVGATANTALVNPQRLVFDEWRSSGRWYSGLSAPLNNGQVGRLEGMRPIGNGVGAVLVPAQRTFSFAGTPSENRYRSVIYNGTVYFSAGNKLFRLTATAGMFTGFVDTGLTFSGSISDMVVFNGLLHIAMSGSKLYTYDGATLTDVTATYSGAWFLGVYNGMLFWTSGIGSGTLNWRVTATPANYSRNLELILSLVNAGGSLWIGTRDTLYRLTGTLKAGNPGTNPGVMNLFEPEIVDVFKVVPHPSTQVADYNFYQMVAAYGYLWFWCNGRVYRLRFSDSLGSGQGVVEPQPLFGKLRGMNICDGMVIIALESGSRRYLWAWEPEHGWWLVESGTGSTNNYSLPFSGFPQCKDAAICSPMQGEYNLGRWPLDNGYLSGRNPTNFGLSDVNNNGYIVLPGFGLDDLARAGGHSGKGVVARLMAVGVEWGCPGELSDWFDPTNYIAAAPSAGAIAFAAEISIDGGASWVSLGSFAPFNFDSFRSGKTRFTVPGTSGEAINLTASYPGLYIIRVKVNGPHAPAVHRVWVEYKLERTQIINGREWRLRLAAGNPADTLSLGGQPGSTNGGWASAAAALDALRNLWTYGVTADYMDVDASGPYRVKLKDFKAIKLGTGKPYDWEFAITLAEVTE